MLSGWKQLTFGLDMSGTSLFLLDTTGTVRYANPAARRMIQRSVVLRVENGRFNLRRRDERALLKQALDGVNTRPEAKSNPALVLLRDREGRVVLGLTLHRAELAGMPRLILARVADLITVPVLSAAWLVRLFGLTPAEARVIGGLIEGLDLKAIATRNQSALETVRGHVKRTMTKLGVRSQAQLVRLVAQAYDHLAPPEL